MIGLISTLTTVASTLQALWVWTEEGDLTTTEDLVFKLGIKTPKELTSECGAIRLDIEGTLYITKGYKFDGCTGVPDGQLFKYDAPQVAHVPITSTTELIPLLWEAPLIHDALYGLLVKYWPELRNKMFNRRKADKELRKYMKDNGSIIRGYIYYWGLRVLGGAHIRKLRNSLKSKVITLD